MTRSEVLVSMDPEAETLLRIFCRHLVALCVTYRQVLDGKPAEQVNFVVYSGTLLAFGQRFVYLTAGHALEKLHSALKMKQIVIEKARLLDYFASEEDPEMGVPFDLANERMAYVNDEEAGLDVGIIELRRLYILQLATQNVKALQTESLPEYALGDFDAYAMVGLPEERTEFESSIDDPSDVTGIVQPTLFGVNLLTSSPDALGVNTTTYERLIGQLHEDLPLGSIVGMSGGPIFGLKRGSAGADYRIVAIQSSWLPDRKIIFGCPISAVSEIVERLIQEWDK